MKASTRQVEEDEGRPNKELYKDPTVLVNWYHKYTWNHTSDFIAGVKKNANTSSIHIYIWEAQQGMP